ncbi:restriction endonuclease subunit S [Lactobacillus gallinarum]|uniref:restriction endonuclease subunit S n=1 Tax=Lactobacillus gallinarum TaxID=52242 RepID=UPI0024BAF410|nr:restriction endonuclease subunit S [Lactobacillus gallinarum]
MTNSYVKLGDLATYINGYAFKPKDRGDKGLPIIRIQDLTGNTYDKGFYDGKYPSKIEINNGDVLISWSASLGVYLWNGGKALLNQHIFKVIFDKKEIDKDYFIYAVRFSLKRLHQLTHGATMKHIVKKDFDNVVIPYPSIKKQKEIAFNLDKIESIIKTRQQEIRMLDTLIKARFVEMFGDPLRNDKTWPISKLKLLTTKVGSGATPKGGKQSYKKEGITLVRSMNVHDGEFVYKDLAYIDTAQAHDLDNVELQPKDVFINITGASVARSCVIPDNILPGRVNQHVAIIRCKENLLNYIFLNRLFLNSSFKQKLLAMGQAGGATRQALTQEQLKKLNLILPPIELQNEFASFVQQVDKSKVVNASIMKYIISIRFYLYFKENKEGAR